MTFLETLQSHRGGLIRLKTELYWYGGRGYDGSPDRICLLLDSDYIDADSDTDTVATTAPAVRSTSPRTIPAVRPRTAVAAALLLIDGSPQWVWAFEADIEILVNDQPTK